MLSLAAMGVQECCLMGGHTRHCISWQDVVQVKSNKALFQRQCTISIATALAMPTNSTTVLLPEVSIYDAGTQPLT